MDVRLLVHLERHGDGATWWAESPQVPGFSVAADSLTELQILAKWALADILCEDGGDVSVTVELVENEPITSNPTHLVVQETQPAQEARTKSTGTGRTRVASPA